MAKLAGVTVNWNPVVRSWIGIELKLQLNWMILPYLLNSNALVGTAVSCTLCMVVIQHNDISSWDKSQLMLCKLLPQQKEFSLPNKALLISAGLPLTNMYIQNIKVYIFLNNANKTGTLWKHNKLSACIYLTACMTGTIRILTFHHSAFNANHSQSLCGSDMILSRHHFIKL